MDYYLFMMGKNPTFTNIIDMGVQAVYSGIPVYYALAVKLVQAMEEDYDGNPLNYRLSTYNRLSLIIVDEIWHLPLSREEPSLFFQFVLSRQERRSTIYTSSKGFSELGEILGDQVWHGQCWIEYCITALS